MKKTEVETDAGIKVRRKQHQVEVRKGSLVMPERQPTKAELELGVIRRRKRAHQKKLRGGM